MKKKFGVTLSFTLDVDEGEDSKALTELRYLSEQLKTVVKNEYPEVKNTVVSTQEYPND